MSNDLKSIRFDRIFAWFVFLYFIRVMFDRILALVHVLTGDTNLDYRIYDISDWLINYEGGFVRRGLIGQILWEIEQIHLYDVRMAIAFICLVASIAMILLIWRIFKEEGWSFLILPTGFVFGFTLFKMGGRRDLLSLLLTYIIFLIFKSIVLRHRRNVGLWVLLYVVSAFQIFMHEASFFYIYPILMLFFLWTSQINQCFHVKNSMSCILYFIPIFLSMALVCIYKGDPGAADIIWNSWKEVFDGFPSHYDMSIRGMGVEALTWDAIDTFGMHLRASYIGTHSPSYMLIPIALFNLIATYLLVSRINTIDMGLYKTKQMDNVLMSNVLIIQFVSMIPMFTILSCDWGRTIPYWILSSCFFYHIFKDLLVVIPHSLTRLSERLQRIITKHPLLSNKYTYIAFVLLSPVPWWGAPFDFANTFQQGMIQTLQYDLHRLLSFWI